MGDFEKVAQAAREAQNMGREIFDGEARTIAALFHNGQASPSYSFASTGAIEDPTELWRDLFGDYSRLLPDEQLVADMMGTYLSARADRGPVPGWSHMWVDIHVPGE